ncbi:unnamed protein product [Diatraea saccharalis]|uniref:Uncharacterized protein n=1 Tax=Diatraea saccharalis TaxID=40085 RepID=A0A9N9R0C0_9NEOP|nr:unnamed protein product [Diatraea saccharalis]
MATTNIQQETRKTEGKMYPTPAVIPTSMPAHKNDETHEEEHNKRNQDCRQVRSHPAPGSLPDSASQLHNSARALLMRLLERDPRVRMRNLRQLQQSAFFMGFNFETIKALKVRIRLKAI